MPIWYAISSHALSATISNSGKLLILISLARIGNKKLADAPVPDDDIGYLLQSLGLRYRESLQEEIHARATVKGAYHG